MSLADVAAPPGDAPPRVRRRVPFHHQLALVTVAPWALFLGLHTFDLARPLPLALLALALGVPHVLATFGLYVEPGLREHVRRHRVRYYVVPALLVPSTALAFAASPVLVVKVLFVAFLVWQSHHFTKQNLGVYSFWCKSQGLAPASTTERRIVLATAVVGMTGVVRMANSVPELDGALRVLGLATVVACIGLALRVGGRKAVGLLAAVAFFLPLHVFDVGLLGAAVSYQMAHGAQYYLMVGKVARPRPVARRVAIAVLLLGGVLMVAAGRQSALGPHAWAFGLGKGIVAAHFVADAGLWRLSDRDVRQFMKTRFDFL